MGDGWGGRLGLWGGGGEGNGRLFQCVFVCSGRCVVGTARLGRQAGMRKRKRKRPSCCGGLGQKRGGTAAPCQCVGTHLVVMGAARRDGGAGGGGGEGVGGRGGKGILTCNAAISSSFFVCFFIIFLLAFLFVGFVFVASLSLSLAGGWGGGGACPTTQVKLGGTLA